MKRATSNYLVLVWNRHVRVNFKSRQEILYKIVEFPDQISCTCSSDYSGTHQLFLFSFEAFSTAFWEVFVLGRRKPVENGETLNSCQDHNVSL